MSKRRLDLGDGGAQEALPVKIERTEDVGAILRAVHKLTCPDCQQRGILPARINGFTTEFSCECGMIIQTDWSGVGSSGVKVIRIGPKPTPPGHTPARSITEE